MRLPACTWRSKQVKANLAKAHLVGTSLEHATLLGADLTCAILYGANLFGARLTRATLVGAELAGATFAPSTLLDADLSHANLASVSPPGDGADIIDPLGYIFSKPADVANANFYRATLTGVGWPEGAPIPEGWKLDTVSGRLVAAGTDSGGQLSRPVD